MKIYHYNEDAENIITNLFNMDIKNLIKTIGVKVIGKRMIVIHKNNTVVVNAITGLRNNKEIEKKIKQLFNVIRDDITEKELYELLSQTLYREIELHIIKKENETIYIIAFW